MEIKKTLVAIVSERSQFLPGFITYFISDLTDDVIRLIIEDKDIKYIQTNIDIPHKILCKLDKIFVERPEISFRIYGGLAQDFNGWDLKFLRSLPNLQRLILNCFEYGETDLSALKDMIKLRSLMLEIIDLMDFSFINSLPEHMEELSVSAVVRGKKNNFDCRWLLRFQQLHTLTLDKIDINIESIVGLKKLRKLELRAMGTSNLSFLKQLSIEDLSLLWCTKPDLSTLQNFDTLRRLRLFRITNLTDISFISTLVNLEVLELKWLRNIIRLPDVSELTCLNRIEIDTLNKLTDISSLANAPNLKEVSMICVKSVTKESVRTILNNESIERICCWLANNKKEQAEIDAMIATLGK